MAATERIPVLVTKQEKVQIAKLAKEAGLSMGEFLRRGAAAFQSTGDDPILEGMIRQMADSTARASAAMDDAIAFVDASNARMAKLEVRPTGAQHGRH